MTYTQSLTKLPNNNFPNFFICLFYFQLLYVVGIIISALALNQLTQLGMVSPELLKHRVYRVPGFLSSRPNWVPHPLTRKGVFFPTFPFVSGDTLAGGEGVGGPNSDEGTDTLVLYVHIIKSLYVLKNL
jgi:hypothetical protein